MANGPIGYNQGGGNLNVVKWIESDWTESANAIAITMTTFDCGSGQIYDADVILNDVGFSFTTDPQPGVAKADIQNTLTHEVGHVLGFDHDPDPSSVMYPDEPLGETKKRTLSPGDIEGVCAVYPLGKGPGTGGCSASGGESASAALVALLLGARALRRRARL